MLQYFYFSSQCILNVLSLCFLCCVILRRSHGIESFKKYFFQNQFFGQTAAGSAGIFMCYFLKTVKHKTKPIIYRLQV